MGKTDRRVRVPGTSIKVKQHHVMAAVARFLAEDFSKVYCTSELMDFVSLKNGKSIRTRLKNSHQLASCLKVHPHFDCINQKLTGDRNKKAYWFLQDRDTYLLGEGHAFPPEFYRSDGPQNKKGRKIKLVE
tara:strand:+ start:62 stop:454 length:393 start_codon:yes stop_codon:yes gene_type:complete